MKKILVVAIALIASVSSFAQDFIPDTLFTSKVNDIEYAKNYANNEKFAAIQLKDGSVLKVGDPMQIGQPSGMNTVRAVNSGLFNSTVSNKQAFQFLIFGRIGMSAMAGMNYLPGDFTARQVTIKEIKASHTSVVGSKKSPLTYWLILDLGNSVTTALNLDQALATGELVNPKRAMTRSEAITKLKETKDLLELGMIKQEEYEKIKTELTPIITQNN
jgi:hypothetical protein